MMPHGHGRRGSQESEAACLVAAFCGASGCMQAVVAAPLETLDVYAGLREVLVVYNAAYGARAR